MYQFREWVLLVLVLVRFVFSMSGRERRHTATSLQKVTFFSVQSWVFCVTPIKYVGKFWARD